MKLSRTVIICVVVVVAVATIAVISREHEKDTTAFGPEADAAPALNHVASSWEALLSYGPDDANLSAIASALMERNPEDYRISGYRLRTTRDADRLARNINPHLTFGGFSFRISTDTLNQSGPIIAIRAIGSSDEFAPPEREHVLRSAEQLFAGVMDCFEDVEDEFYPLAVMLRGVALQTLLESCDTLPDRAEIEARAAKVKEIVRQGPRSIYTGEPF